MTPTAHSARLVPKFADSLRGYTRSAFAADLIAGLTVGLVALPEAGLYTAVVAGLVVSAFGGSRCQIAGPTGAFVVIVAGIVARFGVTGLLMCTAMAGVMLVVMGLTGLGAAVQYIPRAVTIGFTNGIAVLIASTQVKDFFGLSIDHVPSEFIERMKVLAQNAGTVNPTSLALAAFALAIILLWPRVTKRVPGSIVALLVTTAASVALGLSVETIGSKFGGIPTGLPSIRLPEFDANLIGPLLPSAVTVALLAAIESLLSAVVADNMSGDKHKPDVELVAQGAANLLVPLVGGIPATGAIARTATNIRSGAKSPVAGMVHALVLLAVLLAAAPLARFIPLPTLAAVLLVVAYNMGEWREIPSILRLSTTDGLVWGVTFGLTVFADLTVAVEVGMVLAALVYVRQVTHTTTVAPVTKEYLHDGKAHVLQDKQIPAYVTILRIHGPFLFGAAAKLEEATADLTGFGPVVILRLRNMTAIDCTGVHALEELAGRVRRSGRALVLCGARKQPGEVIDRSDLPALIGSANILPHIDAALARAAELYAGFSGVGAEMANGLASRLLFPPDSHGSGTVQVVGTK
jgi:sulfate permease, SulP family